MPATSERISTAACSTQTKSVEEPVLPEIDEEFCKAFGVIEGGLPKLREDVTANMRRELEQALRNRNKAAVMEKLYTANPTEVPNVLIEGQIRDMQVEAMRRAGTKDAAQAPPREPFIEPARRREALGLLLNDVIHKENLVVDRARVNERLDEMVSAYGDAGAMKRAYLQNAEAMRQVESLALEDQAVDWILAAQLVALRIKMEAAFGGMAAVGLDDQPCRAGAIVARSTPRSLASLRTSGLASTCVAEVVTAAGTGAGVGAGAGAGAGAATGAAPGTRRARRVVADWATP